MKVTLNELTRREHRAAMRVSAMLWRKFTHPEKFNGTASNFHHNIYHAAAHLTFARNYNKLSQP